MAKVGYARVSTLDQDTGLQLDALSAAGCAKVFEDHASGARADRVGLRQALDYMRDGDMLIVLLVAGFQPRRAGWNLTGPSKIRSCNVDAAAQ